MWDEYVRCRRRAQAIYNVACTEYNNSLCDSLTSAQHSHKWWSSLKTFLFGVNTSLPPMRTEDGSVPCSPSEMAEVFSGKTM